MRRSVSKARPARRPVKRAAARKPQTIKIVLEQPGSTVSRPDITEEALVSSKIEKNKRRAKL